MPAEKERSCWLQPSSTPKSLNYLMIHSTHKNIWRELAEAQFGTRRSHVEHSGAGNGLGVDGVAGNSLRVYSGAGNSLKLSTVGQGTVSSWTQGAGTGLKTGHWSVIMPSNMPILLLLPMKLCPDAFISISLPGLPESQWYTRSFLNKTGFALTGILLVKIRKYWKQNQQSVRHPGCYAWSVLIIQIMQGRLKERERERKCVF